MVLGPRGVEYIMVTMMEQVAYEASLKQDRAPPTNTGGGHVHSNSGTPTRRARLQMAKSPRHLLHHQRSVGHYNEENTADTAENTSKSTSDNTAISKNPSVNRTSSDLKNKSCQISHVGSNSKGNLEKLRAEAFLKPLPLATPSTDTGDTLPTTHITTQNTVSVQNDTIEPSVNVPATSESSQPLLEGSGGVASSSAGSNSATPLRVGFYEIERTIGRGNFAIVKLARHRITRTEVCSKSRLYKASQKLANCEFCRSFYQIIHFYDQ